MSEVFIIKTGASLVCHKVSVVVVDGVRGRTTSPDYCIDVLKVYVSGLRCADLIWRPTLSLSFISLMSFTLAKYIVSCNLLISLLFIQLVFIWNMLVDIIFVTCEVISIKWTFASFSMDCVYIVLIHCLKQRLLCFDVG